VRFLLDTNIVSETMRVAPNRRLLSKLSQHEGQYAVSVVTWQELVYGIERLPDGARKQGLQAVLVDLRPTLPMLPLSFEAAAWLGVERARLEKKGKNTSTEDGQIAATAWASNLTVVTANKKHFSLFRGVSVVDWTK